MLIIAGSKLECQICKKKYSTVTGLGTHIGMSHADILIKEYYDKYIKKEKDEGICSVCGNNTSFRSLGKGYFQYCSTRCSARSPLSRDKIRKTCLKKYGVEHCSQNEDTKIKKIKTFRLHYGCDCNLQNKEVKEKIKQTNLEKYGAENPFQNKEIREKQKNTILKRYGVTHCSKISEVKEKKKQTSLSHFGVEYPSQSEEIKEKKRQTCLEKYGVEYVFQNEEVKEKYKQTYLEHFGVKHPLQSEEVKEKIKLTNLERYGVENVFQTEEIKEKNKQTCLSKYGFENPAQSEEIKEKILENKRILFFNKLLNSDRLNEKCIPNFIIDDYKGIYHEYSWICNKCQNVFEDHLMNGHIPRCSKCYPKLSGTSKSEKEINDFIKSLGIETISPTREIISPKEIDIYIPSHNLAIEFNGLYWHSEDNPYTNIDKDYHLNKTISCQEKGIQLLHIFEDEWIDKQEIVKSIITAKLGKIENKIYARKCQMKEVPNDDAKLFLFDNHLQGSINGTHMGLYYEDALVSILTYGKSRFNKKYEYEILRFCNKINTIVIGGLSKLLKYLNLTSIITYADLRYGTGESYLNCGFQYLKNSDPSYYYLENYSRLSRFHFQKHLLEDKLDIFDSNLTEWENMQLNGYDRIWDCGTISYGCING